MSNRETYEESTYRIANGYLQTDMYESYLTAKKQFEKIPYYRDSAEKIEYCKEKLYECGIKLIDERKFKKARGCFAFLDYRDSEMKLVEVDNKIKIRRRKFSRIVSLVIAVALVFYAGYEIVYHIISYNKAETLVEEGKTVEAAIAFAKLGNYKNADERSNELWDQYAREQIVVRGAGGVLGVTANGRFYVQRDIIGFGELIPIYCYIYELCNGAISSGDAKNGYLQFEGYFLNSNETGSGIMHEVSDDTVAAASKGSDQIFLRTDGTVVRRGDFGVYRSLGWKNIVELSSGNRVFALGLRADGKVEGYNHSDIVGEVDTWEDIISISAGENYAVGLKADGTVVACGNNEYGQCNVSEWTDIIAVSAGKNYTIGLKKDGTVVACGDNKYGQCEVSGWTDIVAISVFEGYGSREEYEGEISFSAGFKTDGTVILTNAPIVANSCGRFKVDDETLEKNPKIIIQ